MKPHVNSRILFCCYLILIASCSRNESVYQNPPVETPTSLIDTNKEESFIEIFPIEEMNTKIKFWSPQETFKAEQCLDLPLENTSNEKIIFPSDYGLRILAYMADQWKGIDNVAQYVPAGSPQVSPKSADLPGVIVIPFCPDWTKLQAPVEIRIVVTAETELTNNTKSIPVAAFIDLVIEK